MFTFGCCVDVVVVVIASAVVVAAVLDFVSLPGSGHMIPFYNVCLYFLRTVALPPTVAALCCVPSFPPPTCANPSLKRSFFPSSHRFLLALSTTTTSITSTITSIILHLHLLLLLIGKGSGGNTTANITLLTQFVPLFGVARIRVEIYILILQRIAAVGRRKNNLNKWQIE